MIDIMPSGRIILTEDDATSRVVFTEALRGAGYEVMATETAEAALQQMSLGRPSMLLLDFQLPGMDGREMCRRARAMHGHNMPILFVTTSDTIDALDACLKAGGNDFLIKTERPADILKRVNMWRNPGLRKDMERRRMQALARVDKAIKTGAGLSDATSSIRDAIIGPASVGNLNGWLNNDWSLDFDDFNPLDAFGEPTPDAPGGLEKPPWEPSAGRGGDGRDSARPPAIPPLLPDNALDPAFGPDEDLSNSFFDALDNAPDEPPQKPKPAKQRWQSNPEPEFTEKPGDDLNELRWE